MFDYYAMPDNTPGIDCTEPDPQNRMRQIETIIDEDIDQSNCKFHFMLHEFEGILFSKPSSFRIIADGTAVQQIQAIRDSYPTPEHINNSHETAPSKRLKALIPNYAKVRNGTLLSKDMGLNSILEQCPHFNECVQSIVALAKE